MKPIMSVLAVLLCFLIFQTGSYASDPVKLIFDTDMGNDIDDALALAVIHALESRGECDLLAVTSSKDNPWSILYCDVVNSFYGRPEIPLGRVNQGATHLDGSYTRKVVKTSEDGKPVFARCFQSAEDIPEAVSVLRSTLAKQPDHSVTLVVVGFSTNIARLLQSPGDQVSPLTGLELVSRKVKLLSQMIGRFDRDKPAKFHEYNVRLDVPAAKAVYELWPKQVPVVVSGWEVGRAIQNRAISIQHDYGYVKSHPIKLGYEYWHKMPYDRPTYDLTSVLYAVRPGRGYFGLSKPGQFKINELEKLEFTQDTDGNQQFLTVTPEQIVRVQEVLENLSSQPPAM
ncbi:nucleoside hydrolase [Gimesia algae]|uniref:Ribonucleoside hydrolase RihC n=1 Tax=Gimesia algae TaxID=2527971 RepID=A0A517VFW6_9PLAN|nr:nucleoside hydrolase [Gimesia algae]QDT91906.1 ribonucleoside hydrolase RihC [Gimesia algae]